MAAPLQYLLIDVNVGALEKVSFSDTQNPKTVCYLREPIHMQLSQKEKTFSQFFFFFCIFKIYIKILTFAKKN